MPVGYAFETLTLPGFQPQPSSGVDEGHEMNRQTDSRAGQTSIEQEQATAKEQRRPKAD
jgi:hypothetical protein